MSLPLLDDAVTFIYPLVAGLATALGPVGGASAAIVAGTLVLRLLLLPLAVAAVRGERRRAVLAPQVSELRRRHGGDPAGLAAELTALYRAAGTTPAAGCLPMLVQAPFLLVWYRVFTVPRIPDHTNTLLARRFLGAPLTAHLLSVSGGQLVAFAPLLLAIAGLALLAVRRAGRVAAVTGSPAPTGPSRLLPFASLLSAVVLPLAAVLYLVTTLSWSAAENAVLRRGLPPSRMD